jgi:hypothetical protein
VNTDNQADIYACLDRLLASATFAHAQRMKQLLRYLVSETLAGRAGQLKGYTIAIEVFGRSEEFDPALDAIVRVQAGHLRAKLREYYDGEGSSDSFRFELPKGGYAIRIEATQRRSPFAEQDVPSTAGRSALKMPTLGPIVEGAGTGEFPRPAPIEDKPSLAVLPFVNWSSDPEQDYFADGITEDLTTELSRLSGLFVISRHSAFVYKGVAKSAAEISAELGVVTCSKAACAKRAPGCESRRSWPMPHRAPTSGRSVTIARSRISSPSRMRSPSASSPFCR